MTLSVGMVSRWHCRGVRGGVLGGGRGDDQGDPGGQADLPPGEPAASGNILAACNRAGTGELKTKNK